MESILLFSILALLAVIMLLMIMIADQVRGVYRAIVPELEAEPEEPEFRPPEVPNIAAKISSTGDALEGSSGLQPAKSPVGDPFRGLSGKSLWDSMAGRPMPDVDDDTRASLRPLFQWVLLKHIEELFHEGSEDGLQSRPKVAPNERLITGPEGAVLSWIPQQYADTVYRSGFDSVSASDTVTRKRVQGDLTEAIEALCARTEVHFSEPLASKLVPIYVPGPVQTGSLPQLELTNDTREPSNIS
jgi:hypothetical protein